MIAEKNIGDFTLHRLGDCHVVDLRGAPIGYADYNKRYCFEEVIIRCIEEAQNAEALWALLLHGPLVHSRQHEPRGAIVRRFIIDDDLFTPMVDCAASYIGDEHFVAALRIGNGKAKPCRTFTPDDRLAPTVSDDPDALLQPARK